MGMLAVVVVLVAAPACTDDYETGVEAYQRGDYATALTEFRPLAQQGDARAQYNLGVIYSKGQGVPQDYAEALHWYRQAAEQGDASGQFGLGGMYLDGRGVPRDYAEAVRWYRQAAEQGDARAKFNLSVMYRWGRGVPMDDVQAHMWLSLAASQGEKRAPKRRDRLAKKMTPAKLAEAQRLAREWKPKQ